MRERIAQVRALTLGSVPTASDQPHWAYGRIAAPMSIYPDYRESRASFGLGVLRPFVVEVETESGVIGIGLSSGGEPACWLVERHLASLVEGKSPDEIELVWDQMWRSSLFYGRKGLALHAISAVDLALWDLLGRLRGEPVYNLIGGPVRDAIPIYATGPHAGVAKQLGFVGAKLPLVYGPADGEEGLRLNVDIAAQSRADVGDDFPLAYDCWMALDLSYALRLAEALAPLRFLWLEECLPPDDYWGYAELKRRAPRGLLITTGEHEATRFGFRLLIDMRCCDVIQPDVTWCGGLTELLKIASYADAHGLPVIPHASGVYGLHFSATRVTTPFAEYFMGSVDGLTVVATHAPLLVDEPMPQDGHVHLPDRPGFGVELNRDLALVRPYSR
jgi:L-rhamnonate dehydratase